MTITRSIFRYFLTFAVVVASIFTFTQKAQAKITTGAEQTDLYLPLLKEKRVALLVNQTSQVNGVLLPDFLLSQGVNVVKIFSPEHGFRGTADAGATVKNGMDPKTQLPVISLYGKNKKPSAEQLKDVDILIYDLQDVGVRFYTYISTLQYALEACAEQQKDMIILDRPNPLGWIVDGPVLEKSASSFVGMQPIPVIYGMTPAEYAQMLIGEKWIAAAQLKLKIIPCSNYTHQSRYNLPVAPSPNLKNMTAIYLYPSLCFFEGTVISVGRGTDFPFQMYGHPLLKQFPYQFTPETREGASNPLLKNQLCYGELIADNPEEALNQINNGLNLEWLIKAYQAYPDQKMFFNNFFRNLAGTSKLREQMIAGKSLQEIKASWQPELDRFKKIRKKYLLYAE